MKRDFAAAMPAMSSSTMLLLGILAVALILLFGVGNFLLLIFGIALILFPIVLFAFGIKFMLESNFTFGLPLILVALVVGVVSFLIGVALVLVSIS